MLTQMPTVHRRHEAIWVTTLSAVHLHELETTREGNSRVRLLTRRTRLRGHRRAGRLLARALPTIETLDRGHLRTAPWRETRRGPRRTHGRVAIRMPPTLHTATKRRTVWSHIRMPRAPRRSYAINRTVTLRQKILWPPSKRHVISRNVRR